MAVRLGPLLLRLPLSAGGAAIAIEVGTVEYGQIGNIAGGEGEGDAVLVAGAFGGEDVEGGLTAAGFGGHGIEIGCDQTAGID